MKETASLGFLAALLFASIIIIFSVAVSAAPNSSDDWQRDLRVELDFRKYPTCSEHVFYTIRQSSLIRTRQEACKLIRAAKSQFRSLEACPKDVYSLLMLVVCPSPDLWLKKVTRYANSIITQPCKKNVLSIVENSFKANLQKKACDSFRERPFRHSFTKKTKCSSQVRYRIDLFVCTGIPVFFNDKSWPNAVALGINRWVYPVCEKNLRSQFKKSSIILDACIYIKTIKAMFTSLTKCPQSDYVYLKESLCDMKATPFHLTQNENGIGDSPTTLAPGTSGYSMGNLHTVPVTPDTISDLWLKKLARYANSVNLHPCKRNLLKQIRSFDEVADQTDLCDFIMDYSSPSFQNETTCPNEVYIRTRVLICMGTNRKIQIDWKYRVLSGINRYVYPDCSHYLNSRFQKLLKRQDACTFIKAVKDDFTSLTKCPQSSYVFLKEALCEGLSSPPLVTPGHNHGIRSTKPVISPRHLDLWLKKVYHYAISIDTNSCKVNILKKIEKYSREKVQTNACNSFSKLYLSSFERETECPFSVGYRTKLLICKGVSYYFGELSWPNTVAIAIDKQRYPDCETNLKSEFKKLPKMQDACAFIKGVKDEFTSLTKCPQNDYIFLEEALCEGTSFSVTR